MKIIAIATDAVFNWKMHKCLKNALNKDYFEKPQIQS